MSKIAICTDTNSGLTQKRGEELGIFVLPMTFTINDQECVEGLTIKHTDFFRLQSEGASISTSQPSPQAVTDLWDEILEEYDALIHIPMSSALSGSCQTAAMLAEDYDGRVTVIDNCRLSATLMQSCLDAKFLADGGSTVEEIRDYLNDSADDACIYVAVDDLKYLKAGGRLSASAASIGTLLNIKPVLTIDKNGVDAVAKARGMKAAKKKLIQLLEEDLVNRFHTTDINDVNLHIACSLPTAEALEWKEFMEAHFGAPCTLDRLPLSLAVHTGFGCLGVGMTLKLK